MPDLDWGQSLTFRQVQDHPGTVRLEADEATRRVLAKDMRLERLDRLSADLAIRPWLDGVEITGQVRATAGRLCGVTLEPFDEIIDEPVLIRVVPAHSAAAPPPAEGDIEIDLEAEDPPDVVDGETLTPSDYVRETLALALSPFPRKPGAVFEPPPADPEDSPFAALKALKDRP